MYVARRGVQATARELSLASNLDLTSRATQTVVEVVYSVELSRTKKGLLL